MEATASMRISPCREYRKWLQEQESSKRKGEEND